MQLVIGVMLSLFVWYLLARLLRGLKAGAALYMVYLRLLDRVVSHPYFAIPALVFLAFLLFLGLVIPDTWLARTILGAINNDTVNGAAKEFFLFVLLFPAKVVGWMLEDLAALFSFLLP